MWAGEGGGGCRLRPRAASHRRRRRAAVAAASVHLRGLAETRRRKMYVKITCFRDALYKTINLSVFTTVHTGYKRRVAEGNPFFMWASLWV